MAFMKALFGTGEVREATKKGARAYDELAARRKASTQKVGARCVAGVTKSPKAESRKPKAESRKPKAECRGLEPAIARAIAARLATTPRLRYEEVVAKSRYKKARPCSEESCTRRRPASFVEELY